MRIGCLPVARVEGAFRRALAAAYFMGLPTRQTYVDKIICCCPYPKWIADRKRAQIGPIMDDLGAQERAVLALISANP
ncbi:hypothetical protein, partial [Aureimonas populi]